MSDRPLPPLRLLAVFEAFVRTGSVQRAGADLNVTQPAVSQSLRLLEAHLGTALLDRRTRPASLTPAGQVLRSGVAEGMGRIARACADVREASRRRDNAVTIACTLGTATYWLMPRLAGFYEAHPDIAVNVQTTAGLPGFQHGVDLVIRYGHGRWPDGTSTRLFADWVRPVCSPAVRERLRTAGGMATAPLLHVDSEDSSWLTWQQYLAQHGIARSDGGRVDAGRHFSNYVLATQAALAGQGLLLGWESNAGDLVREGRLVEFGAPPCHPAEAFFITLPTDGLTPAGAMFRDWLLELCG
jgi:DNA-binding transcriptional LysR family regulator